MSVVFLHPPPDIHPSGGNVYNRHLLAKAQQRGFPLAGLSCASCEPVSVRFGPDAIVLWDSLFLEELAHRPPEVGGTHGLLVHYLPFLNPLLNTAERSLWTDRFDHAADRMQFLIATGCTAAHLLERRYPGKRVFLCEPGVDSVFATARRPAPRPGPTIRLATVAHLLPAKGQSELLEVLANLQRTDWEWHLIGEDRIDRNYTRRLWAQAEHLGVADRMVRHGVLDAPNLARLLSGMDLFVFPSHYEAYGMALAEAAAAGVPIVTTAVGEAARIVRDGETGFVVPVGDREGFREALAELISDEVLRRHFRTRLADETPRNWEEAFGDFEGYMREVCSGLGGTVR